MPGVERYCPKCKEEIAQEGGGQTIYEGKKWCECEENALTPKSKLERLKHLDNVMYNFNANLSALVHIQKVKTKEEGIGFLKVVNRSIAGWIKEVREIHESMEEEK